MAQATATRAPESARPRRRRHHHAPAATYRRGRCESCRGLEPVREIVDDDDGARFTVCATCEPDALDELEHAGAAA